jgi:hypothetical protein
MIRWKHPGNWCCLWRICHEPMHAGNSVDSGEILGVVGGCRSERPARHEDERLHAIAAKWRQEAEFVELHAGARAIGYRSADIGQGMRRRAPEHVLWPAELACLGRCGRSAYPEARNRKSTGPPYGGPVDSDSYSPPAYFSGAASGRPNFQLALSVMMSDVTSARFAGCDRSITPTWLLPAIVLLTW